MEEERDFNDILEEIVFKEDRVFRAGYLEGFKEGQSQENPEAYHLGYQRGLDIGRKLGYYLAIVTHHMTENEKSSNKLSEKALNQLTKVKELIDNFPESNDPDQDVMVAAENVQAQYKKACALLKIPSANPNAFTMEPMLSKVRFQLQSTVRYLSPLLPLANCHMVEFLTQNHWENMLPRALREYLDTLELSDGVNKFWCCFEAEEGMFFPKAEPEVVIKWVSPSLSFLYQCLILTISEKEILLYERKPDTSELHKWVHRAKSHYLTPNNDYILNLEQLKDRIGKWGGQVTSEIRIKEFMTSKKSYEVGIMSSIVSAISQCRGLSCCVEAGGGRGSLLAALNIAYGLPALTVDCDDKLLDAAKKRVQVIRKQWRVIAQTATNGTPERIGQTGDSSQHKFARAFITSHTDIGTVVSENFPDLPADARILLTGLHTCGNLGPDSLRIFLSQPAVGAVLTVPCCYHLLTEGLDVELFDVFHRVYGGDTVRCDGFPMSNELRGYNLGRNGRMLAAQSVDRVVHSRELPAISLLYRALLQVIIKEHLPNHKPSEGKLKRISKCNSFIDYFKMADNILHLDLFDKMEKKQLSDVCKNMENQWKKLVLFYLIRLCIAQVIESVILLDRLLFLLENGAENVFLVKLFDPVMSPRCHAILALR